MAKEIQVAIAEENAIFRRGLGMIVDAMPGFRTCLLANSTNALTSALSKNDITPEICLLGFNRNLSPTTLPIEALKSELPSLKVLVMLMNANEFNAISMLQKGVNGLISKKCTDKELRKALLTLHHTGIYHDDLPEELLHKYTSNITPFISARETQFLMLLCSDISYKDIASKMNIDLASVELYRDILFQKLNVTTRIGLVMAAYAMGLDQVVSHN